MNTTIKRLFDPDPVGNTGGGVSAPASAVLDAPAGNNNPAPALPADHWAMHEALPPEVRGNIGLKDFKTMQEVPKAYIALQGKLGNSVALPKEGAPQEEWDKFYTRMGRPESADKYELPKVTFGENVKAQVVPEKESLFRKLAFETGVSNKAAGKIYEEFVKADYAMQEKAHKEFTAREAAALAEYQKSKGEKWEETQNFARLAIRNLGGDEKGQTALKTILKNAGLANNPVMIEVMSKMGRTMVEDTARGGGQFHAASDAVSARAEITRLTGNSEFQKALFDGGHLGHKEAVKKWTDLHGMLGKNG